MKRKILLAVAMLLCILPVLTFCADPAGPGRETDTGPGTSAPPQATEPVTRTEPTVFGDFSYTLDSSVATITAYSGAQAELTIPETVDGFPVGKIGRMAFANHGEIRSLTVPGCVTEIGDFAFFRCEQLASVILGDGVQKIGMSCFNGCASLREAAHTGSLEIIEELAFRGCEALENFDLTGAYSVGQRAFAETGLVSVTVPESVKYLSNASFLGCRQLRSATILSRQEYLSDHMFAYCDSLTEVVLPDSLNIIGEYSFYRCTSLTSLTLPAACSRLKGFCLFGCTSLETVYFLHDGGMRIDGDAMEFLPSLKTVFYAGTAAARAGWTVEGPNYALTAASFEDGYRG